MEADRISMEFFRNAGMVCLIAATAAFIAALIMFFNFDIPAIIKIRTGLAAQAALHTNVPAVGKPDPVQDIPFQIVRKIIITESDEAIDLQDIFDRQDMVGEACDEKQKKDSYSA